MNRFFESVFPKKDKEQKGKEVASEQVSDIQQEPIPLAQEKKPKTLEYISEAKNKVNDLETQKKELINKHRDNIEQLKNLGVNEKQADSVKRSETFNDVLNPIEDEIKSIAEEISNLKEDNDLQQKPKEILKNRIERLNELCYINIKDFLSTENGKNFLSKISENELALNPQTAIKYSDFIIEYCNRNNERDILDRAEFKSFKDKDMRIRIVMDNVDSRLLDMNTTR